MHTVVDLFPHVRFARYCSFPVFGTLFTSALSFTGRTLHVSKRAHEQMLLVDPELDEYLRLLQSDEAVQEDSSIIASGLSSSTGRSSGVHFVQKMQTPRGQGHQGLGYKGSGAEGDGSQGNCYGCGARDH